MSEPVLRLVGVSRTYVTAAGRLARDGVLELVEVFQGDPLVAQIRLVKPGGVEDRDRFVDVGELAAAEIAARAGGIR